MNPKMSLKHASLVSLMVYGSLISVVAADVSTAQKFETCRAAAEVAYGSGEEVATVRLEGVRKAGKQLKLRVHTPEGDAQMVLCEVDGKSGEMIALNPPQRPAPALALGQTD